MANSRKNIARTTVGNQSKFKMLSKTWPCVHQVSLVFHPSLTAILSLLLHPHLFLNAQFETQTVDTANGNVDSTADHNGTGRLDSSNGTKLFADEDYFEVYGLEGRMVIAILGLTGAVVVGLVIATIVYTRRANKLSWPEKSVFSNKSFPTKRSGPLTQQAIISDPEAREKQPYDHKKAIMSKYLHESKKNLDKMGTSKHTGETVINVIRGSDVRAPYNEQFDFDSVSQPGGPSKMPEFSNNTNGGKKKKGKKPERSKKEKQKEIVPRRVSHPVDRQTETAPTESSAELDRPKSRKGRSNKMGKRSDESSEDLEELGEPDDDKRSEITDDTTDVESGPESVSVFPLSPRKKAAKKDQKNAKSKEEKKDWKKTFRDLFPRKTPTEFSSTEEDINKPTAGRMGVIQYVRDDLCSCMFHRGIYVDPQGWQDRDESSADNWNPMAEMVTREQESYPAEATATSKGPASAVEPSTVSELSSTAGPSSFLEPSSKAEASDVDTEVTEESEGDEDAKVTLLVKMPGASVTKEGSDVTKGEDEDTVGSLSLSEDTISSTEASEVGSGSVANDTNETTIT